MTSEICPLCGKETSSNKMAKYMNTNICVDCFKAKNPNATEIPEYIPFTQPQPNNEKPSCSIDDKLMRLLQEMNSTLQQMSRRAEDRSISIADVDIPFLSMIVLMVKWAIAAIPAMIILMVLGAISSGFIVAITRPLLR